MGFYATRSPNLPIRHYLDAAYRAAHRTLRMTPAMAAGVTDHLWTVTELIDAALESEGELVESA
jgi:hypothetical protein